MDQIKIENLVIFAHHGVFPEENVLGQKFVVNCTLYVDTRKAGTTDALEHSVHYGEVAQLLTEKMQERNFQLIETVAETLARAVLHKSPLIQAVDLEIQKPWAPVGLPLDTVAVKIHRAWHTAYIALGSNLGDRKAYLEGAVQGLRETPDCVVEKVSTWLETEPYGYEDQDIFLNGALKLRTLLTPRELLDRLHELEQAANRERLIHWGPRTLDLDILLYDDAVIQEDDLCIPHVDMKNRFFVLSPLAEIAPYYHHPVYGLTIQEMLQNLNNP